MFATLASPEELRPFVSNFDRDIIRMGQFSKYHEAATEIAKRLTTGTFTGGINQLFNICGNLVFKQSALVCLIPSAKTLVPVPTAPRPNMSTQDI